MQEIILFPLWKRIENAIEEVIQITPFKRIGNKNIWKGSIQYTKTNLREKKIEEMEIKDFTVKLGMGKEEK
jgi:hypothetical protein